MFKAFFHLLLSLLLLAFAGPSPATADCTGTDLFAALPKKTRLALIAEAEEVPHGEGLIFRATKGKDQITLAGTFHLPDARHQALVEELAPEIAKATVLMVEAGPEEEARLKAASLTDPMMIFDPDGPTLPELLREQDWQVLRVLLARRGIPPFLAAKMKPAMVAMMVALPPCALPAKPGAEAGTAEAALTGGLDHLLIAEAETRDLPIVALEPWDTVFGIFDAIPQADISVMLEMAIEGAQRGDDVVATMSNLYFSRRPRLIEGFARLDAQRSGFTAEQIARETELTRDLLEIPRNRDWLPKIEAQAAQGPVLVAVGAAHLSGEQGLLALLEADGWVISRLD